MKGLYELREGLCKFTEQLARNDEFSPGQIDMIDKALNGIKNTYKIEMFEEETGGRSKNGSFRSYAEDGGSYRRGSLRSYAENSSRGSFAEDSYRRGSSRHGEDFKIKIREMMEDARDEKEREAFRRVLMELEE